MSKASEYKEKIDSAQKAYPQGVNFVGRLCFSVTQNGTLLVTLKTDELCLEQPNRESIVLQEKDALTLARWIIDTFGEGR